LAPSSILHQRLRSAWSSLSGGFRFDHVLSEALLASGATDCLVGPS
jgi:hypothetical protein